MARFFFSTYGRDARIADERVRCESIEEAIADAILALRSSAAQSVVQGRLCLADRIDVRSDGGRVLAVVTMEEAVTVTDAHRLRPCLTRTGELPAR